MLTPAVRALREKHSQAHLTFSFPEKYLQVFGKLPFADRIISSESVQPRQYDWVLDTTPLCNSFERPGLPPRNRIDIYADFMKVSLFNFLPYWKVEEKEKITTKGKLVVIHTTSEDKERSWPGEVAASLTRQLRERGFLVAVMGKPEEDWGCADINLSRRSLRECAAYIEAASLFIGPDSGPMHVAAALSVPSLVLFGATLPGARINHYPTHKAITVPLPCLGCWYQKCVYGIKCMTEIKAETVLAFALEHLSR